MRATRSQNSPSSQTSCCVVLGTSLTDQAHLELKEEVCLAKTSTTIVPHHTWFHVFFKHMFKSLHVVQWWGACLPSLIPSTTNTKNVKPTRYSSTPNTESCANLNDYQETEMQNVPQYSGIYCPILLSIKISTILKPEKAITIMKRP